MTDDEQQKKDDEKENVTLNVEVFLATYDRRETVQQRRHRRDGGSF